jgi:predicted MarR family transcription regulator
MTSQRAAGQPDENALCLSDLEYPLYVAAHGFWRWQVHCAEAAGARNLGSLDIQVLHTVNHRARNKRLGDICLVLNLTETHTVAYCLKKLQDSGLVDHEQSGRDRIYRSSATGDALCRRYREIRWQYLVRLLEEEGVDFQALRCMGDQLLRLARFYDEAGRAATVASAERA